MKKFTKFCLITALVLAVVGGGLFFSGLLPLSCGQIGP